jgi:hypothetical protein
MKQKNRVCKIKVMATDSVYLRVLIRYFAYK